MASGVKYMKLEDFMEEGYLHELNRGFLHPHGLALEVTKHEDGTLRLSGVQDFRQEPHGMTFKEVDAAKAANVASIRESRRPAREGRLGFWIQPIPGGEAG